MRKRCKRKVLALVNPLEYAIEGARISDRTALDRLLVRELASLDAFTRGKASLQEWSDLASMNNVAQTLATMGVGKEVMPVCHQAEEELIEAAKRFERTGRMGLTGEGIKVLRDLIEYHDLQRASISRSQYEEGIRLTGARIKSGYATTDLGAITHGA